MVIPIGDRGVTAGVVGLHMRLGACMAPLAMEAHFSTGWLHAVVGVDAYGRAPFVTMSPF